MNQLVFQIIMFFWVSISVILGLFVVLKSQREEASYIQIFLFLISPLLIVNGLLFVKPHNKKSYFRKLKTLLFLN
jgi:hypothetical protein